MMEKDLADLEKKIIIYEKKPLELPHASPIVLVGGCFDLIHFGHIMFLNRAKKFGSVVVALESDMFIRERKKRDPVHVQHERAIMLAALSAVDVIVELPFLTDFNDYRKLVEDIHPSVIGVTEGDKNLKEKEKQAQELDAKIVVIRQVVTSPSTTTILKSYETLPRD